jgi:NADPH-dependent ferric siderophore reductase
MTEHFNEAAARRGQGPWIGQRGWLQHRRGQARRMMVAGTMSVTGRMQRVSLVSDDLDDFRWSPGQDMVLELPLASGETARRHYTIRHYDEAEQRIDIDIVLHGAGASAPSASRQWLDRVRIGDKLIAVGPRGHTRLAGDVTRHLFVGDESCIPAIAAMAEHLHPAVRAQALIEVVDEADIQPLNSQADLTVAWLYRKAAPAGSADLLLEAVKGLRVDAGATQAYVIGETGQVRAVRQHLIAAGMPKARITAEGYWRPGRIGGHDHVF